MRSRQRLEGASGFAICDTRHLPIVVVRWFGTLDLELVAAFARWITVVLDALAREDLRVAMVLDISGSEPPNAEVRRALVEIRTHDLPRIRAQIVEDFVVINRPALRAAVAAMHWISPPIQSTPVASLDQGLQRCHDALAREGIVAPRLTAAEFEGLG